MLRRLKLTYMLYNLFQKKQLQHNRNLYQKLGLNKYYFSPVSSADFEGLDEQSFFSNHKIADLNTIDLFNKLDQASQESVQQFETNGYAIIRNYLNHSIVDRINQEIDSLVQSGKLGFKNGDRLMFAIHQSNFLQNLWEDKSLNDLLSILIKGKAQLFQSINFLKGSQQKTHSDSIHMTTFPLGGLLGVWLALEDIDLDNGPLHYFPKSHQLPYYMNKDYDNKGTLFFLGNKGYKAYEKMIAEKVEAQNIQKQVFTAKKGDLLIWHANLLHGGEPHLNNNKTRKSMVLHYFDTNRICYHEITQRPALMHKGI